jgi:hypothetical protein
MRPGPVAPAALIVLTVIVGACTGPPPVDEPRATGARVEAKGFVLEVRLPSDSYAVTDAIPIATTLTWTGAPGRGQVWSSTEGPVAFLFKEVGGRFRAMGGGSDLVCARHDFPAGQPIAIPLGRSGGWDDTDPNAAFYRAWYRDPLLHLPEGHWRLSVTMDGMLAPCDANAPVVQARLDPIDLFIR